MELKKERREKSNSNCRVVSPASQWQIKYFSHELLSTKLKHVTIISRNPDISNIHIEPTVTKYMHIPKNLKLADENLIIFFFEKSNQNEFPEFG